MQTLCQAFFLKRKLSNTSSLAKQHDHLSAAPTHILDFFPRTLAVWFGSGKKTTELGLGRTFCFKSQTVCYFSNYLFFTCTYVTPVTYVMMLLYYTLHTKLE